MYIPEPWIFVKYSGNIEHNIIIIPVTTPERFKRIIISSLSVGICSFLNKQNNTLQSIMAVASPRIIYVVFLMQNSITALIYQFLHFLNSKKDTIITNNKLAPIK